MKRLILFLLLWLPLFLVSQKEANIWYFGENAGLDFSSGIPVAITNSAMNKDEGCASISDSAGNLLFYTSGLSVWNKNHQLMANGNGLAGHNSSTQSALIVPKPGNNSIYYIFTTDAFFYANGLKYSIVDMSMNSGLGAVTQKNIALISPVTEKLTAVKHSNGNDFWMIAHYNNNSFAAYPITSSGVGTPVITAIGSQHVGGGSQGTLNAIGYMKTSPSGSKLALTIMYSGIVELFDFNTTTGVVSNAVTLNNPTYNSPYGIEFSPSEQILYFTADTALYQADISSGNAATIQNSVQQVGAATLFMSYLGALQLGPDQRIYCVDYFHNYVSVINFPDALGTECQFVHDGVSLNNKHCYAGLPNFVTSYLSTSSQSVMEKNLNNFSATAFPNPATGLINFAFNIKNEKLGKLEVYSAIGKKVYEQSIPEFTNQLKWEIPENLPNGVYLYAITVDGSISTGKIIVNP